MSTLSLPHTNGSSKGVKSQTWLQMPVHKFFMGVNWEDQPPEVQEIKLTSLEAAVQGNSASLSLTLSVNQFFSAIPWDGIPMGSPAESVTPEATSDDGGLTLDDFSGLF